MIKKVDDAINEILAEDEYFIRRDGFIILRIQNIAKKMHPHLWRYRDKILEKIHKWTEQHPTHSEWTDAKGRIFIISYGEQMHPVYGTFRKDRPEDTLALIRRCKND